MENFRNYYDILGIAPTATADEIKSAYRKLARRYHPDLNPGNAAAEESFKTVGEAYEILSDVDKRQQYDQFSRYWRQTGFGGRGKRNADGDFSQFKDFDTFVDQLLNRRSAPSTSNRRRTVRPATATDTVPSRKPSNPYDAPKRTKTAYTVANGRQAQAASPPRQTSPAPRQTSRAQGQRDGAQRRATDAQLTLPLEKAYRGGPERIRLETGQRLAIVLPPGIRDNQRLHLPGQGIDNRDLRLQIAIEPHPLFELLRNDVVCRIPLTPSEAVLGGAIDVPTLDGPVKMTLSPGTRSGQRLRLAGKGYPSPTGRGDQIVELLIAPPQDITARERELYEKLRRMESNPRAGLLRY
ncbi:MAG: J domain-containing protein [Cyanobacteria bacterium P01_A01_bin.135]